MNNSIKRKNKKQKRQRTSLKFALKLFNKKAFSFKFSTETNEKLEQMAKARGTTKTAVLERLIEHGAITANISSSKKIQLQPR